MGQPGDNSGCPALSHPAGKGPGDQRGAAEAVSEPCPQCRIRAAVKSILPPLPGLHSLFREEVFAVFNVNFSWPGGLVGVTQNQGSFPSSDCAQFRPDTALGTLGPAAVNRNPKFINPDGICNLTSINISLRGNIKTPAELLPFPVKGIQGEQPRPEKPWLMGTFTGTFLPCCQHWIHTPGKELQQLQTVPFPSMSHPDKASPLWFTLLPFPYHTDHPE